MTLDIAIQVQDVWCDFQVFWICEAFDVVNIAVKEGFQITIASSYDGGLACLVLRLLPARADLNSIKSFKTFHTVSSKIFKGWVISWVFRCNDKDPSWDLTISFCHEWHDWVKRRRILVQSIKENRTWWLSLLRYRYKDFLGQLNIPVRNLRPRWSCRGCSADTNSNLSKFSVTLPIKLPLRLWRIQRFISSSLCWQLFFWH